MTLLAPLALLLLAVAVPITLLYVLRLRRPEHPISSTLLWQSLLEDMQANAPWQRLRPSLLLALQLLAVLALTLALARPAYTETHVISGDLIVILDESPSMLARDPAPSRFVRAQARARALASDLGPGNVMSVIGMSDQPRLEIAESADTHALDSAIGALAPHDAVANVLATISLAASLARQGVATRIVILTDHGNTVSGLPVSVHLPVTVIRIGGIMRDLGIVAFAASPGSSVHALLRLRNFGRDRARSDLDLFADGQLVDVRPVDVPPGGQATLTWTDLPGTIGTLEARLTRRDDMLSDKTAWAIVASAQTQKVLLVTPGDYFMQTALSANPGVRLQTVTPADYDPGLAPGADVVVFDGYSPRRLPPIPALLVGLPEGNVDGVRSGRLHSAGAISPVSARAGVLRDVDLGDVDVARIRRTQLPPWLHAVATAGSEPAIAVGNSGQSRVALIAFRLQDSDWPLRVSFPVAIRNLLDYLSPVSAVGTTQIAAGSTVPFTPTSDTSEIRVTKPDGSVVTVSRPFLPFTDTAASGVYSVTTVPSRRTSRFASNQFAPRRPDSPGPAIVHFGRTQATAGRTVSAPVSFDWALGLVALALLSLEWFVAFRR